METIIGQLADDIEAVDSELENISCLLDSMYQMAQAGLSDMKHQAAAIHILDCHMRHIRLTRLSGIRQNLEKLGWDNTEIREHIEKGMDGE